MTRKRKVFNLILVTIVVGLLGVLRWSARRMVYHPSPDSGAPTPKGLEDVSFASEDGTKLHGWLCRTPGAKRAVIMMHGNAGCLEGRGSEVLDVAKAAGAHAFMFDYRGYGKSEGSPYEAGVAADARAALAALVKETGVPRARTVILGHSLGGAVAIDLASGTPDAAGLVVLSSFTSIDDMARHATGLPLGFMVPETWDSATKIKKIACPKLIVHGDKDTLVPFALGYQLFTLAADPKRFVNVQGVAHDPLDTVLSEVGHFVAQCAP